MTTKTAKPIKGRSLVKQLGGAKQVLEELREYTRLVECMKSLRPGLLEKHPDKWVALANGEVVAVADSLEAVLEELDQRGIQRANAVVEFLDTHPRNMIL
ncbi:MAG: hypothetical protein IIB15_05110 [Chloroflexi bacterium]|nr:hypothetical protein [Chloroflexota bacterium]